MEQAQAQAERAGEIGGSGQDGLAVHGAIECHREDPSSASRDDVGADEHDRGMRLSHEIFAGAADQELAERIAGVRSDTPQLLLPPPQLRGEDHGNGAA